jgi:DNA repair exonuclease SbcCD ATPase subunit
MVYYIYHTTKRTSMTKNKEQIGVVDSMPLFEDFRELMQQERENQNELTPKQRELARADKDAHKLKLEIQLLERQLEGISLPETSAGDAESSQLDERLIDSIEESKDRIRADIEELNGKIQAIEEAFIELRVEVISLTARQEALTARKKEIVDIFERAIQELDAEIERIMEPHVGEQRQLEANVEARQARVKSARKQLQAKMRELDLGNYVHDNISDFEHVQTEAIATSERAIERAGKRESENRDPEHFTGVSFDVDNAVPAIGFEPIHTRLSRQEVADGKELVLIGSNIESLEEELNDLKANPPNIGMRALAAVFELKSTRERAKKLSALSGMVIHFEERIDAAKQRQADAQSTIEMEERGAQGERDSIEKRKQLLVDIEEIRGLEESLRTAEQNLSRKNREIANITRLLRNRRNLAQENVRTLQNQ